MMSYCKDEGKDKVVFITKEDYDAPVKEDLKYLLEEDEEEAEGLILPNGDINWSCPCLGGMASGPCSMEFRDAFSCFHYSTEEPKGSDCIDYFRKMQECMMSYPELYPTNDEDKNTESESEPIPSNISTESANTEPIDTSGKDKSGS